MSRKQFYNATLTMVTLFIYSFNYRLFLASLEKCIPMFSLSNLPCKHLQSQGNSSNSYLSIIYQNCLTYKTTLTYYCSLNTCSLMVYCTCIIFHVSIMVRSKLEDFLPWVVYDLKDVNVSFNSGTFYVSSYVSMLSSK